MTCYAIRYVYGAWEVHKGVRGTLQTALSWAESQGCDMLVLVDVNRVRGYVHGSESRRWREQLWLGMMPYDLCVLGANGRLDAAATLNNLENISEK